MDTEFTGSIPERYEECLVPVLFTPYATDLVARAVALTPLAVLEVAAGTGVVTRLLANALARELPDARIVATDLNAEMLAVAAARAQMANLSFQPADAQALPFPDASFDLVLAQFGAMFYPDKVRAFREARRVLAPGCTLLFNVWDRLDANPGSEALHLAVRDAVPEPKPEFFLRAPFSYHDPVQIEMDLREAGFEQIAIERVAKSSPPGSALPLAQGMCLGSPLANELAAHSRELQDAALARAGEAAIAAEPAGGFPMSALVVSAR